MATETHGHHDAQSTTAATDTATSAMEIDSTEHTAIAGQEELAANGPEGTAPTTETATTSTSTIASSGAPLPPQQHSATSSSSYTMATTTNTTTTAAPVAPGPRAARLQDLYAQSLRRTLGKLAWDNFAACYPTVGRRAEGVLRQVQAQMVDKLGEKCEKEFDNIMTARQVVPKLNELERLIGDASDRRASTSGPEPTPPHLLPAGDILAAHLAPSLAAHQSHLNARLQTAQSHNALLYDDIRRQRDQIDALLESLDAAVADVQGANAVLGPIVGQLAAEARQADLDVAGPQ